MPLSPWIGDRQLVWQVMLVTAGEQGRSPPLFLLPRALPGAVWASRRGCLVQWQRPPSQNTSSRRSPFSSHTLSVSRSQSCQELSFCTFSAAKAQRLAHLPKKQAEGFWRRKRNKRTTQDAHVNQNWERRQMWRLFGSQLQCWLLVCHFFPCHPRAASLQPRPVLFKQCESFCSPFPPLPALLSACSEYCLQMAANERTTLKYLLKNT